MDIDLIKILEDIQKKCEQVKELEKQTLIGLDEDHDLLLGNGIMLEAIAKVMAYGIREPSKDELKEFRSMYTEFKELFSEIMG